VLIIEQAFVLLELQHIFDEVELELKVLLLSIMQFYCYWVNNVFLFLRKEGEETRNKSTFSSVSRRASNSKSLSSPLIYKSSASFSDSTKTGL